MSLEKLLEKSFGVRTRPLVNRNPGPAGAAAQIVLPNDPNRLGWTIVNLSANAMYLGLTPDVSAVKGILIAPNGGYVSQVWDEDFVMVAWEWWVIAPAGASNYFSLEMVEDVVTP